MLRVCPEATSCRCVAYGITRVALGLRSALQLYDVDEALALGKSWADLVSCPKMRRASDLGAQWKFAELVKAKGHGHRLEELRQDMEHNRGAVVVGEVSMRSGARDTRRGPL